jgi:uncharacterized protein YjbI with pentapeptide repeats
MWAAAAVAGATTVAAQTPTTAPAAAPAYTIWDLPVGAHATELPTENFIDFACGTNGGPPSMMLANWAEHTRCRPEADGLREVYFRYDDETEFVARAHHDPGTQIIDRSTSAHDIPIIASLLFDAQGFLVGFRMISDPRVEISLRELGARLADPIMARYGEEKFTCVGLPRADGELEFQGMLIKRECRAQGVVHGGSGGLNLRLVNHFFRKRGQTIVDLAGAPTEGQFDSSTHFEARLAAPIADAVGRLARLVPTPPSGKDALIARARNCEGCDLSGANLKRADLTGANLKGANLKGAILHGAILANADLSGADLTGANLNRANLRRAQLVATNLFEAMLYEARLDAANLTGADLAGAYAGRVQLIGANLTDAYLAWADLHTGRLNDANFTRANLGAVRLNDAQLTRSNLSGASLLSAQMWRAGLEGANLSRADMRNADMFGANLREADLTAANFSGARMLGAVLSDAKIARTNFSGAQLPVGFVPAP